ncbi:MAG TPA: hypothetical protein VFW46_16500 [Stellaceae bacterium]|nr:hypothetical protein [Stellaceae bacterium]
MDSSALLSPLTREALFGMNALTLIGFVVMGIGLNLSRARRIRAPFAFLLMGVGTVLVFAGIYTVQQTG